MTAADIGAGTLRAVGALADGLARHGEAPALLGAGPAVTYHELAERITAWRRGLGPGRRLMLLETRNDVDTVVAYLGALDGGHVVVPVPAGRDHAAIIDAYGPDVVVADGHVDIRRGVTAAALHPDLALLLSTSGTTGGAKTVRLSRANLLANAESIAEYLGIAADDRAVTTLPMSYCYGLSVVHSHLLRGAALVLAEQSVVDPGFWETVRRHGVTSLAGVPHTFELLDRVGFDAMELPRLRRLTQAGGRMPPERVRRYAALGARDGWDLVVMYGATEATARMAYLPPELALTRPEAIGRAVPGGRLTLVPVDPEGPDDAVVRDGEVGELVYHGPNVMMGYARGAADLAADPGAPVLHTGDLARRGADGLFEVVGRRSRFVKLYGLRVDLQAVEDAYAAAGVPVLAAATDDGAAVAVVSPDLPGVRARWGAVTGLPVEALHAAVVPQLPRQPSGKPDYRAVVAAARAARSAAPDTRGSDTATVVAGLYADALGLPRDAVGPERSFVDLGGTSLTFVTVSVRLERLLGALPRDWPQRTVADLAEAARGGPRRGWAAVETGVVLRAVALVLVVVSHAGLAQWWGGAHILLGIAGYNVGRFVLADEGRIERLRSIALWVALPTVCWVAIALATTDDYTVANLLLVDKVLGPSDHPTSGQLWFVEVLVWILVALGALLAVPALDRLERRRPFAVAAAVLAVGVAVRFDVAGLHLGERAWYTLAAFWFFALGWAAAKATTVAQRLAVTAVLLAAVIGYFDSPQRNAIVAVGLLLLLWLPLVRLPAPVVSVVAVIAEASLLVYLTHFQVLEIVGDEHRMLAVVASLAVGVAASRALTAVRRRAAGRLRRGAAAGRSGC